MDPRVSQAYVTQPECSLQVDPLDLDVAIRCLQCALNGPLKDRSSVSVLLALAFLARGNQEDDSVSASLLECAVSASLARLKDCVRKDCARMLGHLISLDEDISFLTSTVALRNIVGQRAELEEDVGDFLVGSGSCTRAQFCRLEEQAATWYESAFLDGSFAAGLKTCLLRLAAGIKKRTRQSHKTAKVCRRAFYVMDHTGAFSLKSKLQRCLSAMGVVGCMGCQSWDHLDSPGRNFKVCAGCQKTFYCGRKCQLDDWANGHSVICSKLRALKNPVPNSEIMQRALALSVFSKKLSTTYRSAGQRWAVPVFPVGKHHLELQLQQFASSRTRLEDALKARLASRTSWRSVPFLNRVGRFVLNSERCLKEFTSTMVISSTIRI
jgi:hypothetical protein